MLCCRKGKLNECEDKEYHKIRIYNDPKMQQLAQNLNKSDRIYLTGFINYSRDTYSDGNEYVNGFIEVTNLVKILRF